LNYNKLANLPVYITAKLNKKLSIEIMIDLCPFLEFPCLKYRIE